jgi:hypothetical protein
VGSTVPRLSTTNGDKQYGAMADRAAEGLAKLSGPAARGASADIPKSPRRRSVDDRRDGGETAGHAVMYEVVDVQR